MKAIYAIISLWQVSYEGYLCTFVILHEGKKAVLEVIIVSRTLSEVNNIFRKIGEYS